ncbi:MAG TPA: outer membrane protein transport protein [Paludibacter sp.]|nr:outer membrane protein transport protein [Paludibacter sp.]
MKKIILAITVVLNCSLVAAQTEFDALKLVQPDINGTARYMGMAGAFGALGGDASAIKDNPAGLGVYRTSEVSGTFNIAIQNSNSTWNSTSGKDNLSRLNFSNFSYIKTIPTFNSLNSNYGLLSSNWSFAYNRLKSFNRNSTIKSGSSASSITDYMAYFTGSISGKDLTYVQGSYEPFDNTNIPWISVLAKEGYLINETAPGNANAWSSLLSPGEMVTPTYTLQETGYMDEYSIGWAGNFSNMFYLGTTLNLQSIDYTAQSRYSEEFGGGGRMALNNTVNTSGTGFNLNIGAIIRPTDMIRLGVSVHTPTIYSLTDNNYSSLDYYINQTTHGNTSTPTGSSNYQLNNPWKFDASAALVIGQKGLISAEYDYSMNTNAEFYDEDGNKQNFIYENAGIKDMLKDVQTIKIGGEYRLTNNISLRAGYAYMSGGTNNSKADKLMQSATTRSDTEYFQNNRADYITAGFGYREASWFIDFAYVNKVLDETFYPYNSNSLTVAVNPASVKTTNNNFVVTLGFKF